MNVSATMSAAASMSEVRRAAYVKISPGVCLVDILEPRPVISHGAAPSRVLVWVGRAAGGGAVY